MATRITGEIACCWSLVAMRLVLVCLSQEADGWGWDGAGLDTTVCEQRSHHCKTATQQPEEHVAICFVLLNVLGKLLGRNWP